MGRSEVILHVEGERVHVVIDGKLMLDIHWNAALELARNLQAQAKRAEEYAKANQIIYDSAILLRAGFPLGLSNRKDIQAEARKEAAWNSDLRRYLPGGIKSKAQFGTPTIIKHKPRRNEDDAS